jgi:hypothetical protein
MSIRNDHGFGMGEMFAQLAGLPQRPLHETQIETINTSYEEYVEAYNGRHCQGQRLEECTGQGFYQPALEECYKASADPKALQHAELLVKQFELTPDHP